MLAHLLQARGVKAAVTSARTLSSEVAERVQAKNWSAVCVSVLSHASIRQAEALVRRLGADDPGRAFVGTWGRQSPAPSQSNCTRVASITDAARKIAERTQLDLPSALPTTVVVAVATHEPAA
jgi:methylmalonyl-CoA mutase cobalamin-binding subunit